MKLDQVGAAGARSNWSICHGEELNPVLNEATWIVPRVHNQSPQAALARFVPQSQLSLPLRHVEADVQNLNQQQVEQPGGDDAAVPGAGEAERGAADAERPRASGQCSLYWRQEEWSILLNWEVIQRI